MDSSRVTHGGYLRWPNLYANIQNINNILANIDDVPLTAGQDVLARRLKGEAYFLRAFEYATLLMLTEVSFFHPSHGN